MATNLEIIKYLQPDSIVFDSPSFDNSIIGITFDGRAIYDFDKMIQELMDDENWNYDESLELIVYNTLRTLPYISGLAPVIVNNVLDD